MEFFKSAPGRVLLLSLAIAFLLGGGSMFMHQGTESSALFSASLFLPIVFNIVFLPRALETHYYEAVLAVIALPFLLLGWAVGAAWIREAHTELAWPIVFAGAGALALAAWPSQRAEAAPQPAHATH
jgi:hypothetical protein